MTPQHAQLLLPVIEAYAKGKVVQWGYAENPKTIWNDYDPAASGFNLNKQVHFCNPTLQWRIKPEPPKPREWWVCELCRLFGPTFISGNPAKCYHCHAPLTRVCEVLPVEGGEEQK